MNAQRTASYAVNELGSIARRADELLASMRRFGAMQGDDVTRRSLAAHAEDVAALVRRWGGQARVAAGLTCEGDLDAEPPRETVGPILAAVEMKGDER